MAQPEKDDKKNQAGPGVGRTRLRVCYFGTFSRGEEYARNNAIIRGLEAQGVEVLPCQEDVYPTHEEKMRAMEKGLLAKAWPYLKAYGKLARRYLFIPPHDFMFVGYIGHVDMFPAWVLARLRRKPVVFDAFYSLYDTVIKDRGLYEEESLTARLLRGIDRWSARLADLVLLDTWAHVDYYSREFGIPRDRFLAVPPGVDDKYFQPRAWPEEDGIFDVISYSSYIPLHGLDVQLEAVRLLQEYDDIRFTFVGKGQLYPEIRASAEKARLQNLRFLDWMPLSELAEVIAAADLCLGIFGTTGKALRVIPYKVYMALAMRKPLITGDSPAARELLVHGENALLSRMGDPEALAENILRLRDDPVLRKKIAEKGRELFLEKCTNRAIATSILEELERRFPKK